MPPKKKLLPVIESDIKLIRKANELVEARYKFDIWETRVFAYMLTLIRHNDVDFREYEINAGDIVKEFKLHDSGLVYDSIKAAGEKLLDKKVGIIRTTEDGRKEQFTTHLVASTATPEEKGDYIKLSFHPALKPFLLELKERYLVYDIRNILSLTSIYSVRLFELLKQYQKIGKRRFSVDELRMLLSIDPDEYLLYGHFKGLIKRAEKDLEKHTDIYFTFEEEVIKRKVMFITFFIFENAKNQRAKLNTSESSEILVVKAENDSTTDLDRIFEQVKKHVSKAKVKKWISEVSITQIDNAINYTKQHISAGNKVVNIGGFLNTMVYTPNLYNKYTLPSKVVNSQVVHMGRAVNLEKIEIKRTELRKLTEQYRLIAQELENGYFANDPFFKDRIMSKVQNHPYYKRHLTFEENLENESLQGLMSSMIGQEFTEYNTLVSQYSKKVAVLNDELKSLGYRE